MSLKAEKAALEEDLFKKIPTESELGQKIVDHITTVEDTDKQQRHITYASWIF